MNILKITAHISKDFRATCCGYDPTLGAEDYDEFTFVIGSETGNPLADCETVYAILNSYPTELHCDFRYERIVQAYRQAGHRSLSVGDLVTIDEATFVVAGTGFKLAEGFVG